MNWLQQIWGRRQRTRNVKQERQQQQVTRPSFALGRMIAASAPVTNFLPSNFCSVPLGGHSPSVPGFPIAPLPIIPIDPGFALSQPVVDRFERSPSKQPLIAVIDTGVSAVNAYLDYSKIQVGQDYVGGDNNSLLAPREGNEHGTFVTGMIQAINPNAELFISRAIGSGQWAWALRESVDEIGQSGQPNGIVNLSLDLTQINLNGTISTRYELTPEERSALEYARQNGVLIVTAAGNDGGVMSVLGQTSQEFDNIITIGAADGVNRADYSSYGYGLDVLVPGGTVDNPVLSTAGQTAGTMAGTSIATARATGAISQVWAVNPALSYRQVIQILRDSATNINTPGWDAETGTGLLDLAAALELAKSTQPEVYTPTPFKTPTTWGGEGKVNPQERAASVFTDAISRVGGTAIVGNPINQVHVWGQGSVQDFMGGAENRGILMQLDGTGAAYWLSGDFWETYYAAQGPAGSLGYPISDRYAFNGGWKQDFQGGSIIKAANGTPSILPLGQMNTLFAEAINRVGGLSVVGTAINTVHIWGQGSVQDFTGGAEGRGILMLVDGGNTAYWVSGDFWETYYAAQGPAGSLGYPTSARYPFNGGWKQDFKGSSIIKTAQNVISTSLNSGSGTANQSYSPTAPVQSYFGTSVERAFFNDSRASIYKSQYGTFTMNGAIEAYYSRNYFDNPNGNNGLYGVYSGLGVPTSQILMQPDMSQVMYFEGGSLTNRNGVVTPSYSQRNGDRFDLVGQGAPFGQELQWKNDYSWFNPASVGQPTGTVRRINQGWIQEFTGSPRGDGNSIFLLKDGQAVQGGFEKYTNNSGQLIERPQGGPYRVQGGTLAAYYSVGGYARQSGGLGFPTMSAERSDYNTYKSYQAFENGFIAQTYDGRTVIQGWSGQPIQPDDPRRLQAAQIIQQTFQNEKALNSPIGNLVGDVLPFGNNGWIQYVTGAQDPSRPETSRGAIIYQNGSVQGVAVYDNILDLYDQRGVGTLGYPMSRPVPATPTPNTWYYPFTSGYAAQITGWGQPTTLISPNANGFIGTPGAWAGNTGNGAPLMQREALINKHREQGIAALGAPVGAVEAMPGGYAQHFNLSSGVGGVLFAGANANTAYFILDGIWKGYQIEGGSGGGLGLPRSDEQRQGNSASVQFDNGRIEWSDATRKVRVIYNDGRIKEYSVDPFQDPVGQNEWTATVYRWNPAQGSEPPTNFYKNQSNRVGVVSLGSNQQSNGESGINANWGAGSPNGDSRLPTDNFAVRAYTNAYLEAGKTYKALIRADDGYQLFAKNQATGEFSYFTPQNQWQTNAYGSHVPVTFTVPSSGMYDLHFQLYEGGGNSYVDLTWGEMIRGYMVSGAVLAAYRNRPDLGLPTSDPIDQGNNTLKQTFQNGYIFWNGTTAKVYIDKNSQPVNPPPTQTGRANVSLNFRGDSNTSAPIVTTLPTGSQFKVLSSVSGGSYSTGSGTRSDWYKIEYNGLTGYVAAAYVDIVSSNSSTPPPLLPLPLFNLRSILI